jgi:hypothetical protein
MFQTLPGVVPQKYRKGGIGRNEDEPLSLLSQIVEENNRRKQFSLEK